MFKLIARFPSGETETVGTYDAIEKAADKQATASEWYAQYGAVVAVVRG